MDQICVSSINWCPWQEAAFLTEAEQGTSPWVSDRYSCKSSRLLSGTVALENCLVSISRVFLLYCLSASANHFFFLMCFQQEAHSFFSWLFSLYILLYPLLVVNVISSLTILRIVPYRSSSTTSSLALQHPSQWQLWPKGFPAFLCFFLFVLFHVTRFMGFLCFFSMPGTCLVTIVIAR